MPGAVLIAFLSTVVVMCQLELPVHPICSGFPCFKTEIPGSKEVPQPWANLDGWSPSYHTGKFCFMIMPSIRAEITLLVTPYLCLLLLNTDFVEKL